MIFLDRRVVLHWKHTMVHLVAFYAKDDILKISHNSRQVF
jgi:hypothetical protein